MKRQIIPRYSASSSVVHQQMFNSVIGFRHKDEMTDLQFQLFGAAESKRKDRFDFLEPKKPHHT